MDALPLTAIKYTLEEAGTRLGSDARPLSARSVNRMIRRGDLGSIKLGKFRFVTEQQIRDYESRLMAESTRLAG